MEARRGRDRREATRHVRCPRWRSRPRRGSALVSLPGFTKPQINICVRGQPRGGTRTPRARHAAASPSWHGFPGEGAARARGYESSLRCLKECRSALIRCSGCLTAPIAPKTRLPQPREEREGKKKRRGGQAHVPPFPAPPIKIGAAGSRSSSAAHGG